jgi:thioredoxin reductase
VCSIVVAEAGCPQTLANTAFRRKNSSQTKKGSCKASKLVSGRVGPPPRVTQLALYAARVEWTKDSGGRFKPEEVPGTEKYFSAQLVFLALGFLGPQAEGLEALGVDQDARSNVKTPHKKYSTNVEGVFAAGDCRRGQSLIVWGIQ